MKARKRRPRLWLDLAVPRDIEPEVAQLDDVYLYTVDDLSRVVQTAGRQLLADATLRDRLNAQAQQVLLRTREGSREGIVGFVAQRVEAWDALGSPRAGSDEANAQALAQLRTALATAVPAAWAQAIAASGTPLAPAPATAHGAAGLCVRRRRALDRIRRAGPGRCAGGGRRTRGGPRAGGRGRARCCGGRRWRW